ncbi:carboxylesterase family domain-containing protein [Phthorimaea operculella]|nr:carboxylesterase family domain-containing protein [Phthorimaea operculella]
MAVQPTVTVSEGILQGELIHNDFGENFYSFKGIPYAEPPIGDLRFQPPQPAKQWEGTRNATEFGPINYQYDITMKAPPSGSEDCLYANVYTPNLSISALLPVMVFIHGGAFLYGSGNDAIYGPEFLVRQGVVLVTFNYRLGVLGFLSLDSEDVPGNAGMKDQVAALRWIKKNIRNFGGDPENITIFGESAGAVSVSLHLISPMSKGLFKRAIVQSGSALAYWAQTFEPREKAKAFARQLGLDTDDDKKLYEFFKVQPKETLINVTVPLTYIEKEETIFDLNPVVEKDFGQERFLDDDINNLLQKGIHQGVEVMMGYNQDEHTYILTSNEVLDNYVDRINSYAEALVPINLNRELPIKQQLEIGRKMKKFHFDDKPVTRDDWRQIARYLNLDFVSYGMVQLQKLVAKTSKSFFYKLTCISERNFFKLALSTADFVNDNALVSHGDDVAYMFRVKFMNLSVDMNSTGFHMIDRMTKLWTNFAKHGNPTPDNSLGAEWKPYTLQDQHYLEIGTELELKTRPDDEDIQFWEQIHKQYLPTKQCRAQG